MLAVYSDFISENPKCGKDLESNIHAQAIFMSLSSENNIIKMIDASEAGRPAIEAVVTRIEDFFEFNKTADFDISNDQRRTVIGCMIKTILKPFGYLPVMPATRTQKELSKSVNAKYFKSGSCYYFDKNEPASMEVVRIIRDKTTEF
jgi:hypothetical protein